MVHGSSKKSGKSFYGPRSRSHWGRKTLGCNDFRMIPPDFSIGGDLRPLFFLGDLVALAYDDGGVRGV